MARPKKVISRDTPGFAQKRVQFRLVPEKYAEWLLFTKVNHLEHQQIFERYVDHILRGGVIHE